MIRVCPLLERNAVPVRNESIIWSHLFTGQNQLSSGHDLGLLYNICFFGLVSNAGNPGSGPAI